MNRLLAAANTVASLISAGTFLYFANDLFLVSDKTIGIDAGGFVLVAIAVLFMVTSWMNFFRTVIPEEE